MKTLILTIATVYLLSCERKPDFCKNGKCYTVEKICIKSHKELDSDMYPDGNGGMTLMSTERIVCDKYKYKNKPFKK